MGSTKEIEMPKTEWLKQEAERIAAAEGFAIIDHEDDWTTFMLDDGLVDEHGTLRTAFTWEQFKFEGFVTYYDPTR